MKIFRFFKLKFFPRITVLMPILIFIGGVFIGNISGSEIAFVKVGKYWVALTDDGSQVETNISSGWFPADLNVIGSESSAGSSTSGCNLDLMVANWVDPDGVTIPKVICNSVSAYNPNGTVSGALKSFVRYGFPANSVNLEEVTLSPLGEVDPSKMVGSSEQVVESSYDYVIGVRANRKVYAWSQQNHDNYVVIDVTFTNISDQTLNDFVISMMQSHNDVRRANGNNPNVSGLGQDSYRWRHYYGSLPTDSQRVYYSYHADDPQTSGDNMGNPAFSQDGRLIDAWAQFYGFLHVSEHPYTDPANDVDDPLQPKVTYICKGDFLGIGDNNRELMDLPATGIWWDAMRGSVSDENPMSGIPAGTHHEINNDETGSPDFQDFSFRVDYSSFNAGRYSGIGPYTLEPGQSVRLIYISGYASLSLPVALNVGRKMLKGTLQTPPNLPDAEKGYFPSNFVFPVDASQMDKIKDLWVSTIIDSVHKTMYHARWNFTHDWNVPLAPPPPSMSVIGRADEATITWSDPEAEALPNFAGYRILRRKSNLDTVFFKVIHTTNANDKSAEHTFSDTDVQFGASYYYYIQSAVKVDANDLNALPDQRGKLLWSGRAYIKTSISIEPPRGGTESLDDIIIAPNPYNINDPVVISQGWVDDRGLVFFNLPSYCEVNIYTEDGDHIVKMIHDSPIGVGSFTWDMLTKSQQVIASGVYIATFTDKNGGVSFKKFVVAR